MAQSVLRSSLLPGVLAALAGLVLVPSRSLAQEVSVDAAAETPAKLSPADSAAIAKPFANTTAGEFTPGKGVLLFASPKGSLNISMYTLIRWLDQTPPGQVYYDHLDRPREVSALNAIYWQRSMIWLTGFFWDPRFRYNFTVWSLGATQQILLFGNLQFRVSKGFIFGAGMLPNLTVRSMQGSWPFWAGSDRQMMEEYMRGGFASGIFVTGEALPRLWYTAGLNTNLSTLGVTAANEGRGYAYSGSLQWMPTTGEFGPRGGFGDLEDHKKVATRFGTSFAYAPDEYRAAPLDQPKPNETQLRLSDGVYAFETGALADGVTVQYLAYTDVAADAGLKYRGWSFQGEFYSRKLSNFVADGPVPLSSITDVGVQGWLGYMVVPRLVMLYTSAGYMWDDFERHPYEVAGGVSVYPSKTRTLRLNLHIIDAHKSPTGSSFGYYTAGQTGTTYSIGTDVLF
jgi:hypothetical protein